MSRNPNSTEERLALKCSEAEEARANQADRAFGCGDVDT